ncbi:hypothetical protein SKAU_G00296590 [Synaphobranchus kaupii]|uniref:Rho GTPase-activating protein 27 n=1 Tax=Synaphobranchus kaupii TaxID=118154 RepID=A0A9Q1EUW4_SYNKA|nr:hypothetical protein SKAU_G00296590 [Synaphobranchus kaupii]
MMAASGKALVLVEFEYEYKSRDGDLVSIKPNERYTLLAKSNDHWWHVRKDVRAKPFYIPAKYVKELPSDLPSPLDFVRPADPATPEPSANKRQPESPEEEPCEVTIRVRSPRHRKKKENRMSTFGVPLDVHDPVQKRGGVPDLPHPRELSKHAKRSSAAAAELLVPQSPLEDPLKSRVPSFSPADPVIRPTQAKPVETPTVKDLEAPEPTAHPKPPAGFDDPAVHPKPPAGFDDPESDPDPSHDSENIYESISDIQGLRLHDSPITETAPPLTPPLSPVPVPVPVPAPPPPPPPTSQNAFGKRPAYLRIKTAKSDPSTALYVNISELRKSSPRLTPYSSCAPGAPRHLSADSEEWEVHTDRESGKDPPLTDPAPGPAPGHAPAAEPLGSDWEKLLDGASGRPYFYNHVSRETSWVPPGLETPTTGAPEPPGLAKTPQDGPDYPMDDEEESKPALTHPKDYTFPQLKRAVIPRVSLDTTPPAGWTRSADPEGKIVFTSEHTQEQWIRSVDKRGQTYYYQRDGSKSQWNLPEISGTANLPKVGNGVDQENVSVLKNWRQTMGPTVYSPTPLSSAKDDLKFFPSHMRNVSDCNSDASSSGNSPELPHQVDRFKHQRNLSNQSSDSQQHGQTLEKAGILNKTKISENGKRLRKNWAHSWTVLHGGILTFHKDPKFAPAGNAHKTNQIVPEFTVELRGATVHWATKDKSSKKNVLELKTRHGSEYLVQYDTESIITDWHKVIVETIRQLDVEHHSEEEEDEEDKSPGLTDDRDKRKVSTRQSTSSHSGDTDQGRVRTKLRKFLQRRPTLQSVKEKGYIRDNVFGCNLDVLCYRENTTVPCFVEKCIRTVERRGLDIDGIYRVSGNLAVIQKLRHKADHEENLDLDDGQWEEIHVITGALKLFLRELPEPLFPFSSFERFIAAIQVTDKRQSASFIHDLVKILPLPNLETMKALFKHLRKVVEHGEENRMSVQSVAIVFGPTLLRPETETGNMTMHMIFQSQIVELILNEYDQIFPLD